MGHRRRCPIDDMRPGELLRFGGQSFTYTGRTCDGHHLVSIDGSSCCYIPDGWLVSPVNAKV